MLLVAGDAVEFSTGTGLRGSGLQGWDAAAGFG